jgi:hypothetical protein
MKTWTSTLQIREYDYSGYFYFVIFVDTFMMLLYAINLGAARLFVDSHFSDFSNLEFVMIYIFSIWMNEYLFLVKTKKKLYHLLNVDEYNERNYKLVD